LIAGLLTDYQVTGKKSFPWVRIKVEKHLTPFFARKKAHDITPIDVKAFIRHRQEQVASNGEINRELSTLKRAFNLALQSERIVRKLHIPRLEENNVR
jgi:hypothetical protein